MRTSGFGRLLLVSIAALGLVGCGGSGGGGGKSRSSATTTPAIMTMSQGRAEHSATLLPSGEVLVIGGVDISGDPVATSVIIGLNTVRSGPDLAAPRVGHTATLLTTGQVLVAGGSSDAAGASVLDTTELYDPVTNTFAPGPDLAQARTRHVAASYVRPQGEFVLFAGGSAGLGAGALPTPTLLDTAEVLDVAQGASTAITARLAAPQVDARVARLDTGGVLIVSGANAQGAPAPAQVFNPATQTFGAAPAVVARTGAGVASRGGQVLVAGGESATGLEDGTEVFDAATGTFAQGVRLAAARRDAAVVAVGAGDLVVVGGRGAQGAVDAVEKLSGASLGQAQVSTIQPLASARESHTATAIGGTKLIVVGGYDAQGVVLATVETIDLAAPPPASATTTPSGPTAGVIPTLPTTPITTTPGTTTPGATPGSTPPASGGSSSSGSGGIGGFLGGLFGGSSGSSGSGGSFGTQVLNAALQAAVQAMTSSSGSGFSGFLNAFLQNFAQNLLGSLVGGSGAGGSGLSGVLSSLLGGSSGSAGGGSSGLSGVLTSLLGSLTGGSSSGSSNPLTSLLGGLLGGSGSSGSSSGSSNPLTSLLGGLLGGSGSGGSSSGSSNPLTSLLGGLFGGGSSSTPAPAVSSMTPPQGRAGDAVAISGTNFGGSVSVSFNGRPAQVLSTNTSGSTVTVLVAVPAGVTTGMVTVTTNGQTVNAGVFTAL